MPRTLLGAGVLTILVFTSPAAFAQTDTTSRYTMAPTENGFVRLDTVTGAMSLCQKAPQGWSCRAMDSNGGASDRREIDRLRAENAELRSEVLRLEQRLAEQKEGDSSDFSSQHVPQLELPKEEDVDEAIDYLEGMIRKFRERFENFGEKTRPGSSSRSGSNPESSPEQGSTPESAPDPAPDQKQEQPPATPAPDATPPENAPASPGGRPL